MSHAHLADPETGVSVSIHLPDPALRAYVTFYYFVEATKPIEDFLYPEWGNVRLSIRGEWRMTLADQYPPGPLDISLFGATDRTAKVVSPGGTTHGFGFTPLGWERFVEGPADAVANRVTPLSDTVLGRSVEAVRADLIAAHSDSERAAMFDRLLIHRLDTAPPNSPLAIRVDEILRDRPATVEAFAKAVGVSERTLGGVCRRVFGFGSKRLLRRQRLLDTLGLIRVIDQPEFGALIDSQFVDQAHFNHQFREFIGLTPSEFLAVPRPLMGIAAMAQQQAGITLSFRLPPQPT